jgi:hypothetical protein
MPMVETITVVDHRPASNLSNALGNILASVGIRLTSIIVILVIASTDETWPVCYISNTN